MNTIKKFILAHEPFKPCHLGTWLTMKYVNRYFSRIGNPKYIMDAGCGSGGLCRWMAQKIPTSSIVGYDIQRYKDWDIKLPNLSYQVQDITELTDENRFDLITSTDSLEHFTDNRKVIKSFYKSLRTNGYCFLSIPCEDTELHILPRKWRKDFDEHIGHEHIGRQYTLSEWVDVLTSEGFDIVLQRHIFTFWGTLAWEMENALGLYRKPTKFEGNLNILLMPLYKTLGFLDIYFPLGSGNNLIIARKK